MTARRWLAATVSVLTAALVLGACGSSGGSTPASPSTGASPVSSNRAGQPAKVTITLTPAGCEPKPASVSAGPVEFTVQNNDAAAVTETELKSADLAHIFGEKENLTPGLSGAFSVTLQPGPVQGPVPRRGRAELGLHGDRRGGLPGQDWGGVLFG